MEKTEIRELDIRDKFAMAALAALSGGSWNGTPANMIYDDRYNTDRKMAISAYKIAEVMLEVREEENIWNVE